MGNCQRGGPRDAEHYHTGPTTPDSKIVQVHDRPTIGNTFPNLKGSTQFNDDFDLYKHIGDANWGLIFMHPGDFTPVCTTELGAAAGLAHEFEKRRVSVVGFSCSSARSHRDWIADIKVATGEQVEFPIFCDTDRSHAKWLGILDKGNRDRKGLPLTVRSVYILKPDKTVALVITYPASTGRNMNEILRVIDSLQLSHEYEVGTPANWVPGGRVLINHTLSDNQAECRFGKDNIQFTDVPSERFSGAIKGHYLRYVNDPTVIEQPQEGA
ncbi:MAG: hypothetical protein SGBAC_002193 [Bacillariaceae sp.]